MSDTASPTSVRRGRRTKKMSLKAIEALEINKKSSSESSEDDEKHLLCDTISSNTLTATGKDIFTFQIKKKYERLTVDSPAKNDEKKNMNIPKTPHKLRKRIQKGLASALDFDLSSENPFSASESDYSLSEADTSDDSDSDDDCIEDDIPLTKRMSKLHVGLNKHQQKPKKAFQKNYVIKADEYFSNHSLKKIQTSNHTLDKLKTPRLSQDQLQKLLGKVKLSKEHKYSTFEISENNKSNVAKWLYLLHENFNVLLYGLGSKRNILEQFHKDYLCDLPVLVINGFFPSLTLKDILDSIIVDILELKNNPSNPFEAYESIAQEFAAIPNTHLYIIVHNIEGDMLRNNKSQSILSMLAAVKNIHLIASIDHINAPLIWDHNKLSKFNFTWWDVTSFTPYFEETSFESSMMVQKSGNLALSSLHNVFMSLTTNSKGIYLIIVKHQLENQKNQYYQGLLFKDLYWACREAFLVSSDIALRAQLTEFVDHKLVKFRRSLDGAEYLIIPVQNTLLQQFLNEQKS